MTRIGAFDAKTRLSELLERVGKGESFLITRHGHPVARLVPAGEQDLDRIDLAIARLRDFHKDMPKVSLKELLDTRHDGHRY
jgi:prevent-host-death family protein